MPTKTIAWQAHCMVCNWTSEITDQKRATRQVKEHLNYTGHPDYAPTPLWDLLKDKDSE